MEWKNHFDPALFQYVDVTVLYNFITLVIPFFSTDVLDGAMVTLAFFTLNFAHPGLLLDDSYNLRYNTALSPLTNSKTMA
jgi:hypothetical protein